MRSVAEYSHTVWFTGDRCHVSYQRHCTLLSQGEMKQLFKDVDDVALQEQLKDVS